MQPIAKDVRDIDGATAARRKRLKRIISTTDWKLEVGLGEATAELRANVYDALQAECASLLVCVEAPYASARRPRSRQPFDYTTNHIACGLPHMRTFQVADEKRRCAGSRHTIITARSHSKVSSADKQLECSSARSQQN